MIDFSKDSFHVIADFDSTLTKRFRDGKKLATGYALIRQGKYLGEEYSKWAFEAFDRYHPFEVSTSISHEEKSEKMQEWWSAHWGKMKEYGISKSVFEDIIAKDKIILREGVLSFLDALAQNDVPLLIMSAGIGNLIEMYLDSIGRLTPNVHVVSNFFEFDSEGNVVGYTKEHIHTFNKNETNIRERAYAKEILDRPNVILLGDNLGDARMAEGIEHRSVYKIGFLNDKVEEQRDTYTKTFDLVIENDGDFDQVNVLLGKVLNSN